MEEKLDLKDLKAMAYDLLVQSQQINNSLRQVDKMIANYKEEPKKEVETPGTVDILSDKPKKDVR